MTTTLDKQTQAALAALRIRANQTQKPQRALILGRMVTVKPSAARPSWVVPPAGVK